jgi:hypothetical protein
MSVFMKFNQIRWNIPDPEKKRMGFNWHELSEIFKQVGIYEHIVDSKI